MKTRFLKLFSVVMILALVLPMTAFGQEVPNTPQKPERVEKTPLTAEIPAEIQAMFKDGMSVSDFLARSNGPIPKALESFADVNVTVIVELDQAPVAALYAAGLNSNRPMALDAQVAHAQNLMQAQATVEAQFSKDAIVISRYTKAYNGMLVRMPAKDLEAVRALPGVKAVHAAPVYTVELSNSVPLIGADAVWADFGIEGDGVTIAVIDTGIDYTHAALGGSGDPDDYANNDPDVIEPGTFPTTKVIGGWDFAGTDYNADSNPVPVPDPDPLDEAGHGSHVASTAAGVGVDGVIGKGVAPMASLYALKVFGAEGSTNLTVDAIEWAMDPNGDGDLNDHVDVINMSLGSSWGPNDKNDPDIVASDFASAIGIVVVASAGNSGNSSYIVGSPSVADGTISVAASTTGWQTGPTVTVSDTLAAYIYSPAGFDDGTGHYVEAITAPLGYAGAYTTTNTLCATGGIAADALDGQIALISRGGCAFSIKVNNAASLGAVAALIYNNTSGLISMIGDPVAIPGASLTKSQGEALALEHGKVLTVSAESEVASLPSDTPADSLAEFSSRGPRGYDSYLKPEISAPGVAIYAAAMGTGTEGVSFNGTSMAAPHVAGVAALIKEAHPNYTPEQVKAAMMNTAVDLVTGDVVPQQGAGRVDAYAAISTTSVIVGDDNLVSLSLGVVPFGGTSLHVGKTVNLYNFDTVYKNYSSEVVFGTGSYTNGVYIYPASLYAPAMGTDSQWIDIYINAEEFGFDYYGGNLEEVYGYIVYTNEDDPNDVLRVPFYMIPQPYTELDLTDQGLYDRYDGWATVDQTGAITSNLWAYPVFSTDGWDLEQGDQADVRYVGMDYYTSVTRGPMLVPAFATYGSWHTPQPYFAEFDLYIDADNDGYTDFIDFNFNYGWFSGSTQTNDWVVVQVDLSSGKLYLGSPYSPWTDFNSGFMEWYLPTEWNSVASGNLDFDFALYAFDQNGNVDFGGSWYYDFARPPMYTVLLGAMINGENPGPAFPYDELYYGVDDAGGYFASQPVGAMVVDYHGNAGLGEAYYLPLEFDFYKTFLPLIFK